MSDDETYFGDVLDGWTMSLAQIWGSGPLLTIRCGKCRRQFDKRVRPSNKPVVLCTLCGTANQLNITT